MANGRMKHFLVEFRCGHESFKGYELYETHSCEVNALHARSAINKAKKKQSFKKYGIWVAGIHVHKVDEYGDKKLVHSEGDFNRS